MSTRHPEYTPPSSAEMLQRQDQPDALRLLIAQRRLYSRAKRWLGLRLIGMLVIGLAAPVVSVAYPSLAGWAGGIAGAWLFLGRTALVSLQLRTAARAAAIQEQFDFRVFGMPSSISRSTLPSLEEISKIAGPDNKLLDVARRESLLKWYPIDESDSPQVAVAISQRANASYANQLLKSTALVWAGATILWVVALGVFSLLKGLTALQFLAGVVLPLLPAFLDVAQYLLGIWRAARERGDLSTAIEERLNGIGGPIEPGDLLVWQERLYGLRHTTPEVPNFVYKLQRKKNERAMNSAARQLGRRARGSGQ